MRGRWPHREAVRNVETPGPCSARVVEPANELRARADVELAVDLRQRGLDRALRDDEGRRDLPVRLPFGDELGDATFAWREPAAGRGAAADPCELGARLPRPERGAELVERRVGGLERVARVPLLPGSPLDGTPHELRPRELEGLPDAIVEL